MLPLAGIPESVAQYLSSFKELFKREKGWEIVSRYITGLILSGNKTLEAIHNQQIWEKGTEIKRRGMHTAVFSAQWESEQWMPCHRQRISQDHQGKGKEIISIDWTLSHHERGEKIYGVKKGFDYVQGKNSRYQTVMTASIANRELIDGIAVEVQYPNYQEEELGYLNMSQKENYQEMEEVQKRLLELLHYQKNRLAYRKRTEIAVEIVAQMEEEGKFPEADYAFDNGVLNLPLTRLIEKSGKHWVSELECRRNILWQGEWKRVDEVSAQLRTEHPESFRQCRVKCRNGEMKRIWAFSKTVRLKRYGKKRLVIVHETKDLSDKPRFLVTDALHWESTRVYQVWTYRWSVEVFHEFSKQLTGLESAQVRKEEAVKRHFRLSCVAQSILQRVKASGQTSERFKFAEEEQTIGQRLYSLNRESFSQLLSLIEGLFAQGQSHQEVLEVLMPA